MKQLDFDYVVVGGGAAGCVVAARLATDTTATVALIERGRSDVNRWIHIPEAEAAACLTKQHLVLRFLGAFHCL